MEDVQGQCDVLAKRALIARLRGDSKLASDYAAAYMAVKEGGGALH